MSRSSRHQRQCRLCYRRNRWDQCRLVPELTLSLSNFVLQVTIFRNRKSLTRIPCALAFEDVLVVDTHFLVNCLSFLHSYSNITISHPLPPCNILEHHTTPIVHSIACSCILSFTDITHIPRNVHSFPSFSCTPEHLHLDLQRPARWCLSTSTRSRVSRRSV